MNSCIKAHIETYDTFAKHLGMTIDCAEEGHSIVSMPLDERHKNGVGLAHGGAIFALADLAFAVAANACKGNTMLNVTSSISYMKSGTIGPLTAEAHEVVCGRRLGTYEVRIYDAEKTLLAVCQVTGYRTQTPIPD